MKSYRSHIEGKAAAKEKNKISSLAAKIKKSGSRAMASGIYIHKT